MHGEYVKLVESLNAYETDSDVAEIILGDVEGYNTEVVAYLENLAEEKGICIAFNAYYNSQLKDSLGEIEAKYGNKLVSDVVISQTIDSMVDNGEIKVIGEAEVDSYEAPYRGGREYPGGPQIEPDFDGELIMDYSDIKIVIPVFVCDREKVVGSIQIENDRREMVTANIYVPQEKNKVVLEKEIWSALFPQLEEKLDQHFYDHPPEADSDPF
jgi:hypothetical protein